MPAAKKPQSFDAHVGALISDLSRVHGGRPFLADLLGVSVQTINRRAVGAQGYSVRDIQIVARALNTTPELIVDQALRNYGDGDAEAGWNKLRAEDETPSWKAEPKNVGGPHEDDFEVTPGDPSKRDLALAANKRRKKVNAPYAE